MSTRDIVGVVGQTGSGKTYRLRQLAVVKRRVLAFDWRQSKDDFPRYERVSLHDLPALFQRRTFHARICPARWSDLVKEFSAVAYVVGELGHDLTFIVDEVKVVTPNYEEGYLGQLVRYCRPQGIHLYWATQEPTHIPSILRAECRDFYVFHLHDRTHLQALRSWLSAEQLARVPQLRPREFIHVNW